MVMTNRIPTIVKRWCASIQDRNPKQQLSFYSKDPVLLATFENLLVGREELYDYFVEFLDKEDLHCKINENVTQVDTDRDSIVASGLYTFTFVDEYGETQVVKARYNYVINGGKIINHHSSVQPDE
tara:strand:+ start:2180 stop:2557 length:378 start_codon:yes stop_codon:yes gene_type:complete